MKSVSGVRMVFWTIAAACFAAAAAGIFARVVSNMADRWAHESTGIAVVRIFASDAPDTLAVAERVIEAAPEVADAEIITANRAAAMLAEWGGTDVRPSDLPPLRLLEVDFALRAPPDAPRRLERRLAAAGLAAQVVTPRGVASEATRSAQVLRLSAAAGAVFLCLIMALIVAFSARSYAQRRGDLIAAMADVGAGRGKAESAVGDEAAAAGLYAGIIGAAVAALGGFGLVYWFSPTSGPMEILRSLTLFDVAPVLATPAVAALAAMLGARGAAGALHARAARLA
ncbi:MAG: hypothetical protein JNJ73_15970 [Hyphomonadaceae bacterium]|nr:hypothetical protein [Hyphomonadaceae bacterium]